MRSGKFLHQFTAKDGRKVILRTPRWEDLDDLMEFINSLVEEGADIVRNEKVTRNQEAEWLGGRLALLEKGEQFSLVAEVNGKVVASSAITPDRGYSKHVCGLAIGIKNGYRDIGIGTEMLKVLISEADEMGLKMIFLSVLSTNQRAIHVYEKAGFQETGRRPRYYFKDGRYIDDIIMALDLQ